MKGTDRLQKILYVIMILLGAYIVYKAGKMALGSPVARSLFDSGSMQRSLEDAAVRTWAPGYAAAIEGDGQKADQWADAWMKQITPVYNYLADGKASDSGQTESETGQAESKAARPETGTENAESGAVQAETGTENAESSAGQPEPELDKAESEAVQPESGAQPEESGDSQPESAEQEIRDVPQTADDQGKMAPASSGSVVSDVLLEQLRDFDYLLSHYYTVDAGTSADSALLDADALLGEDLTIEKNPQAPQILIYHTHSQEAFIDSVEGKEEDTIIGMGETLASHLEEEYGYNVIHDTGIYDLVDGVLDRSAAYDYARASIEQILAENPTVEVVIDLHRDGVEGQKFVTEIDGKPASMIMFFNGISRDSEAEPLSWLENPYLHENLAFSLQMQLAAQEKYPGFTRNIYLKAERFNLHLCPRSLLVEAGTQLNTVEEERNAMAALACLLNEVLSGGET